MTSISTHVLDTATGLPGRDIAVSFQTRSGDGWRTIAEGVTDDDGRFSLTESNVVEGTYRLVFETGAAGNEFYPEINVIVALNADQSHYHIPLLLSPFGYTTYRGS